VDVVGGEGARWTRSSNSGVERIALSEGELRLRIHGKPGGRRVLVSLPDGEIEDDGTIFLVAVTGGHAERVSVEEGRVTIRLANASPIILSSGQSWERSVEPHAASSAPVGPQSPGASASSGASALPRDPARAALPSRKATSPPATPPAEAAEEDAAYLHVIQLVREGRETEARPAAMEYLRRFPDGFRREEMGRVAK